MPARCLNKVILIGNLTRDPELRYTPSGSAVCSFGLATNRYWSTETGEKKEDTQFHRAVAWNKLAEICSQLLGKGDKVYLEGRLQTRQWTGADGVSRKTTEIVISDMILLRSRRGRGGEGTGDFAEPAEEVKGPAEGALQAQAPAEEEAVEPVEGGEGEGAPAGAADDASVQTDDASPGDKKKKGKKGKREKEPEAEKEEGSAEEETKKGGEDEETVEIPEDKTPF